MEVIVYMQRVTVIEFGGRAVEKVVVSDLGNILLVTTPFEYESAKYEKRKPLTVGFKKSYVIDDSPMIVTSESNTA
jgi:hypothetical protein